jgi:hypothetical protein
MHHAAGCGSEDDQKHDRTDESRNDFADTESVSAYRDAPGAAQVA